MSMTEEGLGKANHVYDRGRPGKGYIMSMTEWVV